MFFGSQNAWVVLRSLITFAVVAGIWPTEASACHRCRAPRGRTVIRYRYQERGRIVVGTPQAVPAAATVQPTPQTIMPMAPTKALPTPQASGGFVNDLNALRARYGLPAVGEDPNLAAWAGLNNAWQSARGMGHYVMGPARRQNVAWTPNGAAPLGMWEGSTPHRAALLDPTIRTIGLAMAWPYWTFNAQ